MRYLWIVVLLMMLACRTNQPVATSMFSYNPVVAHRGAFKAKGFPENSIAALHEAIQLGCAGSEFDVWMTADDSLVIHHDPDYAQLEIEKTPFDLLSQHRLANGETLPTLRQFLLAGMAGNHHTRLILEIKPSRIGPERGAKVATQVVKLVQELNAEPYITYISFDYGILQTIIALNSKAITQYLEGNKTPQQLKADGITGADYHYSVFRKHPEWITLAKQLGLQLNAWTVNDPAEMDWLLNNKFDFITTNEPYMLLQRLQVQR